MSVDSEVHDQEWAMVNAVGRRSHNSGGKFSTVLQLKRFKKTAAIQKVCETYVSLFRIVQSTCSPPYCYCFDSVVTCYCAICMGLKL